MPKKLKKLTDQKRPIYAIAQAYIGPKKIVCHDGTVREMKDWLDARCIGYVHRLAEATDIVCCNTGDLHEVGYFPYAIIEKVDPGIYSYAAREEYWFKWNKQAKRYCRCRKPASQKNTVGFTIG